MLIECVLAAVALAGSVVFQSSLETESATPSRKAPPAALPGDCAHHRPPDRGAVGCGRLHHLAAHPEGTWDAWAIWNVRAAFLAQPSESWRLAFDPALAHPDYPLLLPGAIARAWVFTGSQPAWIPALIAVAFIVATALVITGSLWRLGGPLIGLAGLAMLMTPEFLFLGTAQIADVPLAFFAVAAVVLAAAPPPVASSRLVLAGLACGCAAWTKNEGLVLAVTWPVLVAASAGWRVGPSAAKSATADLVIGAGPLLVLLAVFKLVLAPQNDVVSGLLAPGALRYWTDYARVAFVAREMALGLFWWGNWPGPVLCRRLAGHGVTCIFQARGPSCWPAIDRAVARVLCHLRDDAAKCRVAHSNIMVPAHCPDVADDGVVELCGWMSTQGIARELDASRRA